MSFAKKIHDLRNKAQETQAANKIIDMLKDIESKNDKTTSYRWIWELIQNAKDVTNSTGKVDILIEFDEKDKFIKFKHNGKLFSTKNIIFLIEQVSTKERGKVEEIDGNGKKTTGKFGTGFLTTHLLSKKVNVSGYLQDDGDDPYSFTIDIDRTSDEQSTIINSIEESCNQLDKNSVEATNIINENEYNTCFTYHLDNDGIRTAKKGLNNLIISAPYVFAFVPEVNSITISGILLDKNYNQTIIRGKTIESTTLQNASAMHIDVNTNGNNKQRCIFTLTDCNEINLALAVEVDIQNKENIIIPIHADLPKLFCDFPLLGTNDFSFPVVINSASFNPTEPRNGVFLTDKETDSEDSIDVKENKDIRENKNIVVKAVELYFNLLEYLSSNNYKGVYHITKISDPPHKEWLSEAWINDNITDKLKSHIQKIELINTHNGYRKPLLDDWNEPCILIPNHTDATIRSTLWNLSSKLIPDMITKHEELEYWYNSLWDECRNYSIEDFIEKVQSVENVGNLSQKINGDAIAWLKEFYILVYSKEYGFAKKMNTEPSIIPNQNGVFLPASSLHIDSGIEEIYKDICLLLDLDIKSMLVHKGVASTITNNTFIKKYTFDDLISDIHKALKSQYLNTDNFYQNIICLKSNEYEKQNLFLDLIKDIYFEESWKIHKVVNFSNEIFEMALNYWIEKMCKDVDKCGSITEFVNTYYFKNDSAAIAWLGNFVDYLIKQKKESQFENVSILPNQNGYFKKASELNSDSGEIVDIVKDICEITGHNIRETLLLKDIYFKLPKSRTITIESLAIGITNYIRTNKNKLGQTPEEKATFRNFYVYLRENRSMKNIETAFNELCANLNWLYNDEDIAENMRIVEEYNDILSKYGVSSTRELETILSKLNTNEDIIEKIEISQEMLAQWGITTEEELQKALASRVIGPEFVYTSKNSSEMFKFVQDILERAKQNVIAYLKEQEQSEYDLNNIISLSKTIFVVNKHGEQIYIIARPSDYEQVIIYYDFEKDVLDFHKDCELWVENGTDTPQKITFGGILKLTGVNKIPLKRI